jgi:hypothetical protein
VSSAQEDNRGASDSYELVERDVEEFEVKTQETPQNKIPDEIYYTKKGRSYTISNSHIDAGTLSKFDSLSEDKRKNFHHIRNKILQRFATFLDGQSLAIGVGVMTKNKLVGLFKKKDKTAPVVKRTVREHGILSVQKMLESLNQKLWLESRNVAFAKEVTFFVNPLGQIILGIPKKGAGGALGFTLAFGFQKETDTMFMDVLADFEKLKSGFVAFAGARLKVGLNFDSSENPGKIGQWMRTEVNNPILVPVWEGKGATNYALGGSLAVALPPMPVDIFHYRNTALKFRILRIPFSTKALWMMMTQALAKVSTRQGIIDLFEEKVRSGFLVYSCDRLF